MTCVCVHVSAPHFVSVHSGEYAEVCGVGDPSVEHKHLLVDHRC